MKRLTIGKQDLMKMLAEILEVNINELNKVVRLDKKDSDNP